jgi:hypothetical protein
MKKDIKDIVVGDRFYCLRENGNEYEGTVRVVRVVKSNRETMVTVYMGRDDDDAEVYRNFYPCDCVKWSAETPEPVYG